MQEADKLYGLIVQAQEMQKYALEFRGTAEDAVERLPEAVRDAVWSAAREILTKEAEKASQGILEASSVASAAADELRGAQTRALLKHVVCLLLVGVVMVTSLYFGAGFLIRGRLDELERLGRDVAAYRGAVAELESKTWGVEFITFRDGGRGIALSKGEFKHIANMEDGRAVVILK
jgi:hypothetical protein